ncbi:MAG TPA: hypothetical protein VFD70_00240 [Anaerolineae bacterium]|nr:hypothetical protein [Anaerolineae bacterium]
MLHHRYCFRSSLFLILFALLMLGTAFPAFAASTQGGERFCTGRNLTINSGETVTNVLAFGCNVTVQQNATVQRNVTAFGGNVSNQGTINGSIVAFGGNVTIESSGVVNGNITAFGGNVLTQPGSTVKGNIGKNLPPIPLPIPPVAPVAPPQPANAISATYPFEFDWLGSLITALAFAALGALVVIIAPEQTRRVSSAIQTRPWGSAGVGCLTLIVLPILALLLVITVVGLPVAFVLSIVGIIAWIFGGIAVGYLAGEKILHAFRARDILPAVAVVVGVLVLMVVGQIPIVGWLISCLVGLLGIGAVVLTRFGTRVYPAPPTMVMTPAAATPNTAPGTFTPSAVDVAAWEAKARDAEARRATTEQQPPTSEAQPSHEERPLTEQPPSDQTPT